MYHGIPILLLRTAEFFFNLQITSPPVFKRFRDYTTDMINIDRQPIPNFGRTKFQKKVSRKEKKILL